jgi:hypothetical protein
MFVTTCFDQHGRRQVFKIILLGNCYASVVVKVKVKLSL